MVFFYLVTTGWIFDISLLCENSINSINQSSGSRRDFDKGILTALRQVLALSNKRCELFHVQYFNKRSGSNP